MQNVVVVIGMIIAAVGPLLLITGKMLTAVGTIMTFAPKLAGLGSTIGKTIGLIKGAVSGLFGLIAAHPVVGGHCRYCGIGGCAGSSVSDE